MKIDRYSFRWLTAAVKLRILTAILAIFTVNIASAQKKQPAEIKTTSTVNSPTVDSDPQAIALLDQVVQRLAHGSAFAAKVRQRVWTAGREVIGVGIYEQSGGGSGRFNLHVSMHDGDGKHTLQQTSDGRLTWTRTAIADEVALKRVDVGRLDEWVRNTQQPGELSPRLKIGAWTEMLLNIKRNYTLSVGRGHLESGPVIVLSGTLKDESRTQVMHDAKLSAWPTLFPSQVKVAIAAQDDPQNGFGKGLPIRFEYWALPDKRETAGADAAGAQGHLITLIELFSIHRIKPPPMDRFRMDTKDAVNFVNETDRYLRQYGIHLTDSQRRKLLR